MIRPSPSGHGIMRKPADNRGDSLLLIPEIRLEAENSHPVGRNHNRIRKRETGKNHAGSQVSRIEGIGAAELRSESLHSNRSFTPFVSIDEQEATDPVRQIIEWNHCDPSPTASLKYAGSTCLQFGRFRMEEPFQGFSVSSPVSVGLAIMIDVFEILQLYRFLAGVETTGLVICREESAYGFLIATVSPDHRIRDVV